LFDTDNDVLEDGHGYVMDICSIADGNDVFTDEFILKWLKQKRPIKKIKGNGNLGRKNVLFI